MTNIYASWPKLAGRAAYSRAVPLTLALPLALGLACISTARAATTVQSSPLIWRAPRLVDRAANAGVGGLRSVSCVGSVLCLTAGGRDIVASTNPSGRRPTWMATTSPAFEPLTPSSLSCPSKTLCVAAGGSEILTSNDPATGASAWSGGPIDATQLGSVSCVSDALCVAGGAAGVVALSQDPLEGASGWTAFEVQTSTPSECGKYGPGYDCAADLTGLSCPTTTLCVAVDSADNLAGDVITSSVPAAGAASWHAAQVDTHNGFTGISCPTPAFCAAVDSAGVLYTSHAPTAAQATWERTTLRFRRARGTAYAPQVSCASPTLCVVTDGDQAAVSTHPAGGTSAWQVSNVDPHSSQGTRAVSCTAAPLCVIADGAGRVIVGVSAAPIARLLLRVLAPRGAAARSGNVLARDGYRFSFRAPASGRLVIRWYFHRRGLRKAVMVAGGDRTFLAGRVTRIAVSLTPVGRRLLRAHHRLSIRAEATMTLTGYSPVTGIRSVELDA